jgi:hypothetical protein
MSEYTYYWAVPKTISNKDIIKILQKEKIFSLVDCENWEKGPFQNKTKGKFESKWTVFTTCGFEETKDDVLYKKKIIKEQDEHLHTYYTSEHILLKRKLKKYFPSFLYLFVEENSIEWELDFFHKHEELNFSFYCMEKEWSNNNGELSIEEFKKRIFQAYSAESSLNLSEMESAIFKSYFGSTEITKFLKPTGISKFCEYAYLPFLRMLTNGDLDMDEKQYFITNGYALLAKKFDWEDAWNIK